MNFALIAITVLGLASANEVETNNIISTLEKTVHFFEINHEQFNLDGTTGFCILRALLKDTLTRWSPSGPGAISQQTKLQDLVVKTDVAVRKSTKEIILREPSYFEGKFIKIVHKSNCIFGPTFHCSLMKPHSPRGGSSVIESFVHSLKSRKDYRVPCLDTAKCRKMMTTVNCADYSLSHQLLYLIIAEIKDCTDIVKLGKAVSIQHLKKVYCTNMMKINLEIEDEDFPLHRRDLFMENIMLCGMIGYSDFIKTQWLEAILSWQNPTGCYLRIDLGRSVQPTEKERNAFTKHKRVKRRDRLMSDNCTSHLTGIAAGALGVFLRFYGISQNVREPQNI
ncbi:UPF0764 protein C16orf89 homolog [Leucoraja erinacea]|uniref:UPF0764 protein C16orf89 homolog n=1 Tax=Leucoraja erinaceus TaxID=7782 RepID=UPI002455C9B2|nr:UPF0764 protein C16orf89 homolog [Leucoraja erinacea]